MKNRCDGATARLRRIPTAVRPADCPPSGPFMDKTKMDGDRHKQTGEQCRTRERLRQRFLAVPSSSASCPSSYDLICPFFVCLFFSSFMSPAFLPPVATHHTPAVTNQPTDGPTDPIETTRQTTADSNRMVIARTKSSQQSDRARIWSSTQNFP